MSYAQWKHPGNSVVVGSNVSSSGSSSSTTTTTTTTTNASNTSSSASSVTGGGSGGGAKSVWAQPQPKSSAAAVALMGGNASTAGGANGNSSGSANGIPAGLRTPTKSGSGMNLAPPHTPTFTTPFKSAGGSSTPSSASPGSNINGSSASRGFGSHSHHHHGMHPSSSSSATSTSSSVSASSVLHALDEFQQADPKFGVKNPCWYCGEESTVECNLCPKIGLETFFCSPQHQTIVWKHHIKTCHPISPSFGGSYENTINSYNPSIHQMQQQQHTQNTYHATSYDHIPTYNPTNTRREPPSQPPLPRYSSPSARQNYS